MKKISVNASSSYDIFIGKGILDSVGEKVAETLKPKKAVVVSDSNVASFYLDAVKKTLEAAGIEAFSYVFPAGEESKRLSSAEKLISEFTKAELTRNDIAVALGGGVCGDLCGFAAAIYMRGIRFVGLPTSLLAMVDSSVGGKTAVDTADGKNLIGAFHQPSLVICDTEVLATLPERYMRDGMAEVIKYGCICDKELFYGLASRNSDELYGNISDIVSRCIEIKKGFVERDEFDTGCRMALNFGHTFGHAIEKLHGFCDYSHGEAVGMGMVIAAKAGEQGGDTETGTTHDIESLLRKYSLPIADTESDAKALFDCIRNDKKASGNGISFILLERIGAYKIKRMDFDSTEEYFKM